MGAGAEDIKSDGPVFLITCPVDSFVAVAEALYVIARERKLAIATCVEVLKGDGYFDRMSALDLVGEIGPDAKEAVPALIKVLKRAKHVQIRHTAAETLGKVGPNAKEAIPALIEALKDTERVLGFCTTEAAAKALKKIDPKAEEGKK